jgi:DNA repair protein RadC
MTQNQTSTNLQLSQWISEERPREKFIQHGRSVLSDAELLAILLGSGNKTHNAVDLARQILASVQNDLNQLSKQTLHNLCEHSGVGQAKALTIMAALELGRRRQRFNSPSKITLGNSSKTYAYLRHYFLDLAHEEFWIICLNIRSQMVSKDRVSEGGYDATPVCIRKLMSIVLAHKASAVILVHNHPSGTLMASEADKSITLRISIALSIFQVVLADHLIVTDSGYFSFRDHDLLE